MSDRKISQEQRQWATNKLRSGVRVWELDELAAHLQYPLPSELTDAMVEAGKVAGRLASGDYIRRCTDAPTGVRQDEMEEAFLLAAAPHVQYASKPVMTAERRSVLAKGLADIVVPETAWENLRLHEWTRLYRAVDYLASELSASAVPPKQDDPICDDCGHAASLHSRNSCHYVSMSGQFKCWCVAFQSLDRKKQETEARETAKPEDPRVAELATSVMHFTGKSVSVGWLKAWAKIKLNDLDKLAALDAMKERA